MNPFVGKGVWGAIVPDGEVVDADRGQQNGCSLKDEFGRKGHEA
jgi:hypothetical protein